MDKINISLGAGHGGIDSGAVGPTGLQEKDVTLAVVKKLAGLLNGVGAFNILLVRKADEYIDIAERIKMAAAFKSRCHVEVHINAFNGKASFAAVWYSCNIPGDEAYADQMAKLIAQSLAVPDGGGRIRYSQIQGGGNGEDYSHEDYYAVIDRAQDSGITHVFMPECGFIDFLTTEQKLRQENYINAIADSIAAAVCNIFSVTYKPLPVNPPKTAKYILLRKGGFYIRSGPGIHYGALTTVLGGSQFPVLAESNGWYKISVNEKEGFIGPGAVANVINQPAKPDPVSPVHVETVNGRNTTYYVRSKPSTDSSPFGVVHGGEQWQTEILTGGFRKVPYGGKIGYVGPAAFV